MQSDATEIERMRAAFFRRTRATTVVLYGALAAAAVGAAIYAVSTDVAGGVETRVGALRGGRRSRDDA